MIYVRFSLVNKHWCVHAWENVPNNFILSPSAVPKMSRSFYLCFPDAMYVAIQFSAFQSAVSRICPKRHTSSLYGSHLAFFFIPSASLKSVGFKNITEMATILKNSISIIRFWNGIYIYIYIYIYTCVCMCVCVVGKWVKVLYI